MMNKEKSRVIRIRGLLRNDQNELTELFRTTHQAAAAKVPAAVRKQIAQAVEDEILMSVGSIECYAEKPNHAFVATIDDRIAGFAALRRLSDETTELKNVMVHPAVQRMGIARRLMDAAETTATAAGYDRIVLWTMSYLEDATRMYERRGYRHEALGAPPVNMPEALEPIGMRLSLRGK